MNCTSSSPSSTQQPCQDMHPNDMFIHCALVLHSLTNITLWLHTTQVATVSMAPRSRQQQVSFSLPYTHQHPLLLAQHAGSIAAQRIRQQQVFWSFIHAPT